MLRARHRGSPGKCNYADALNYLSASAIVAEGTRPGDAARSPRCFSASRLIEFTPLPGVNVREIMGTRGKKRYEEFNVFVCFFFFLEKFREFFFYFDYFVERIAVFVLITMVFFLLTVWEYFIVRVWKEEESVKGVYLS